LRRRAIVLRSLLRSRDLRAKASHPLDVVWDARLRVRTFG
jgi:hypothetical protein